ncbi:ABC-type transport system involved in multi-copper enzyme maturation permease subunit [Spinactinospora alkalitolerans]|uniref:ABC-type transport system involved in multi-copper enzyme maturation permease subunit n=1 Tax=Spinactinospora alkalitolerans TaxID=687207 RepID=A0A852TVD5_9ACTN|nr:ABC transporter permease subunit [Spinactinospora alkalitolerans]NYE47257.1 ABC-type transport system involved in multi-copper enzyme maturation permease subunit [Spinactinospora alkalitolerans]
MVLTALICLALGAAPEGELPQGAPSPDFALGAALLGPGVSQIVLAVLGASSVGSEYSTGMVRLTLAATPRRLRPAAAKALVVGAVTLVAGAVTVFAAFFAGQAVLAGQDLPHVGIDDPDVLATLLGACAAMPFYPLLAMALAVLTRNVAGAVSTVLALMFAPSVIGVFLPEWAQEHVLRLLPHSAVNNLLDPSITGPTDLDPWQAAALAAAWLLVFFGAAAPALTRRDV